MKFSQVFGNFPSFFKSPFSARKRKRDQTEAIDVQSLRPSKIPHGLPTEATALVNPPSLQPVPTTYTVLPQARDVHLAQPGVAELTQPVTNPPAARSLPDTSQTPRLYRPQSLHTQPAVPAFGLHRQQQPLGAQFSASIPYEQLTRQPHQVFIDITCDDMLYLPTSSSLVHAVLLQLHTVHQHSQSGLLFAGCCVGKQLGTGSQSKGARIGRFKGKKTTAAACTCSSACTPVLAQLEDGSSCHHQPQGAKETKLQCWSNPVRHVSLLAFCILQHSTFMYKIQD